LMVDSGHSRDQPISWGVYPQRLVDEGSQHLRLIEVRTLKAFESDLV
jgi:hypothetical protein